jgi:DNA-binding PadR family transcriptional regulator
VQRGLQQDAVERHLPLTAVAFDILLALADGDRHGYSIMQDVDRRADGRTTLHAGTLYRALARLLDARLVQELEERPGPERDDGRRRYYRLTALGRAVAAAEAARLASRVRDARARKLLKAGR